MPSRVILEVAQRVVLRLDLRHHFVHPSTVHVKQRRAVRCGSFLRPGSSRRNRDTSPPGFGLPGEYPPSDSGASPCSSPSQRFTHRPSGSYPNQTNFGSVLPLYMAMGWLSALKLAPIHPSIISTPLAFFGSYDAVLKVEFTRGHPALAGRVESRLDLDAPLPGSVTPAAMGHSRDLAIVTPIPFASSKRGQSLLLTLLWLRQACAEFHCDRRRREKSLPVGPPDS